MHPNTYSQTLKAVRKFQAKQKATTTSPPNPMAMFRRGEIFWEKLVDCPEGYTCTYPEEFANEGEIKSVECMHSAQTRRRINLLNDGTIYASNTAVMCSGAGADIQYGSTVDLQAYIYENGDERRGLISFDFDDTPYDLPLNLTLRVYLRSCYDPSDLSVLKIYRLRETFSDTQTTWNDRLTDTPWGTAGASSTSSDYYETEIASVNLSTIEGLGGWIEIPLGEWTRAEVENGFKLQLIGGLGVTVMFEGSGTIYGHKPQLLVTFAETTTTTACCETMVLTIPGQEIECAITQTCNAFVGDNYFPLYYDENNYLTCDPGAWQNVGYYGEVVVQFSGCTKYQWDVNGAACNDFNETAFHVDITNYIDAENCTAFHPTQPNYIYSNTQISGDYGATPTHWTYSVGVQIRKEEGLETYSAAVIINGSGAGNQVVYTKGGMSYGELFGTNLPVSEYAWQMLYCDPPDYAWLTMGDYYMRINPIFVEGVLTEIRLEGTGDIEQGALSTLGHWDLSADCNDIIEGITFPLYGSTCHLAAGSTLQCGFTPTTTGLPSTTTGLPSTTTGLPSTTTWQPTCEPGDGEEIGTELIYTVAATSDEITWACAGGYGVSSETQEGQINVGSWSPIV